MISREYIINAFAYLGKVVAQFCKTDENKEIAAAIRLSCEANYWFTEKNIRTALLSIAEKMLDAKKIEFWISKYPYNSLLPKRIGLITAGNIPLVGFHDLLSIMLSGNIAVIKPSSKDKYLIKTVCEILVNNFPLLSERIVFENLEPENLDAMIATGSNNSARYFYAEYKAIPLLIRKNRYSLAILDGHETPEELKALGKDIFLYFGLGCRNVSNMFVPKNYDFSLFIDSIREYSEIMEHQGYSDCFRYQRAILELSEINYISNGFLILKNNCPSYSSIATINYMEYSDSSEINAFCETNGDKIQCIVGRADFKSIIPFGQSQQPELDDYADGIDTMRFLS